MQNLKCLNQLFKQVPFYKTEHGNQAGGGRWAGAQTRDL